MFNTNNRYSEDYRRQEDDESDNEQGATPHGNLDEEVHRIAENLRQAAAFSSCTNDIEVEDEYTTLAKDLWVKLQYFARKSIVREVAIIAMVLLFKTGLFLAYREASKANLEIGNL